MAVDHHNNQTRILHLTCTLDYEIESYKYNNIYLFSDFVFFGKYTYFLTYANYVQVLRSKYFGD